MAHHNQATMTGYICDNIRFVRNRETKEVTSATVTLMTARRDIEGCPESRFGEVLVIAQEKEILEKLLKCRKFDIISIKGVFDIMPHMAAVQCPHCGQITYVQKTTTFIYPLSLIKLGSVAKEHDLALLNDNAGAKDTRVSPEAVIDKNYREISNQVILVGTVISEPTLKNVTTKRGENLQSCLYTVGVDRKYLIRSQTDTKADYPWICSYGTQAYRDARHILPSDEGQGTLVLIDGFFAQKEVVKTNECENCHSKFRFKDIGTRFIPYSIEYLNRYRTDEDIAREDELKEQSKNGSFM